MIRYGYAKIETPKEVALVLHRKELLHDIEQYAYVEADTMPTDDEHAKHQLFDINQDGNSELIARTLNIAYNECVEMLYPYTKQEVWDDIMIDNAHCAPSAYNINMLVPDAFSGTTIALLQSLIHRYMVARVMYEWCGIVKPTSMEYWVSLATQAKEQARSALMARRKRLRRKQSLF
jgi:hypothetical protein